MSKIRKPNLRKNQEDYIIKFKQKCVNIWLKKEAIKELELKQDNILKNL